MICNFCKTNINKPIIANNGNMYCPKCLTNIFGTQWMEGMKLDFSVENTSKYIMSEKYFSESLSVVDKDISKSVELRKKAIDLCLDAGVNGNPFAMLNVGYYYENGFLGGDRISQVLNALRWYVAIAIYDPVIAEIVGVTPIEVEAEVLESINEVIKTALFNMQCIIKDNYNYIENSSIKNLFKVEIVSVLGLLQKELIRKGVFEAKDEDDDSDYFDEEELSKSSAVLRKEDPKDIARGLSSGTEKVVYRISEEYGNLLYKAIFELDKKASNDFFKKYSMLIKLNDANVMVKNFKEFSTQYKKRLLKYTDSSICCVAVKKDLPIKLTFNVLAAKTTTFNMRFLAAKCMEYVIGNEKADIIFGTFDVEKIKVLGANIYRNSKVGNSEDYSSDILQKLDKFIKLR